ncbi:MULTISPECIES: tripartite tricarboxylate transporter substrate binding protein [unclassified Variovorax]|uniref:Bug family tripartite tricarboxylate transporter substrate binding protein n=1 Tax=unclassified Variovorax TaxID=663243 RepID=UPI001BD39991|nr:MULTISPECIES: tripartite tricarboxylate transporter substrate binding protein [unclassified Variovorax]
MNENPPLRARRLVLLTALALLAAPAVQAQAWPSKPLRLVVAAGAGSSVEVFARLLADRLSRSLGQPVVVDPRPGANGTIAGQVVATAKNDGYTLLFAGNSALVIAPLMAKNLPYDGEKSMVAVAPVSQVPLAIVVPSASPIRSLQELLTQAKAQEMFFATPGAASLSRLIGENLNEKAGTRLVNVAFPSSGPAHTDVMGGRIPVLIDGLGGVAPHVKSGRMRLLAVSTATRFKEFPDVPAIAEVVPGLIAPGINSVMAPAGTPVEVLDLLNRRINEVTSDPAIAERFLGLGGEAIRGSREDLDKLLREQRSTFRRLIQTANIKEE